MRVSETSINVDGPTLFFLQNCSPEMTIDEEEFEIVKVEELQNQGINVSDIAKLQGAGICSVSVSERVRRWRFSLC